MNAKRAVIALTLAIVVAVGGCGVTIKNTEDASWPPTSPFVGTHMRNIRATVSGDRVIVTGILEYDGPPDHLRNIRLQVTLEDKDENPGVVSEWIMVHEGIWLEPGRRVPFEIPMRKPPNGTWYIMWLMHADRSTR